MHFSFSDYRIFYRPTSNVRLGVGSKAAGNFPKTVFVLLLLGILGFSSLSSWAQQSGDVLLKKKLSRVYADTSYQLDSWTIPSSIRVTAGRDTIPSSRWNYNPKTHRWSWQPVRGSPDSLLQDVAIAYRIIPYSLKRTYARRELVPADTAYNRKEDEPAGQQVRRTGLTEQDLFGDVDLSKSGSLTRGFTVGSNKDLSLESGLQFDMQGQLTDKVEIIANLTDQSTPIQPDGSTQNLREFDKVFIQMRSPTTDVRLGDVDISLDRSEFARFTRRLQGAAGQVKTGYGEVKGALSVARGKFRTMQFEGQDGVQGPYRLTGEQGEQFITVLAGSEQVYINGERVHRGEQNAYTIDYGLGELHFTNNQVITDETRIVVDFQYINRDYNRSLMAAEAHEDSLLNGNLSLTTSYVREADSDDLGARLSLTDKEIEALRQAGDEQAVVSGVDSVGPDTDERYVLYTEVDTTMGGEQYTIYENRPGEERNVYRVRFTKVGAGEGSYRRVGSSVNGILYEWVGPGMGSYAPFERLPAPIRHDMLSIRSRYRITSEVQLYGEWAGSKFDQNRLSSLDDRDNADLAYLAGFRLDSVSVGEGRISADVRQRFTGREFRYFGRTREIEFDRKWNITGGDRKVEERITEGFVRYAPTEQSQISISGGDIDRSGMRSNRQQIKLQVGEADWPSVNYQMERIDSRDRRSDQQGLWYRQRGRAQYGFELAGGTLTPSFNFDQESREQRSVQTDTLTPLSEKFVEVGPGLSYKYGNVQLAGQYIYRVTRNVLNQEFQKQSTGLTRRFSVQYAPASNFQTKNEVALRSKNFTEPFEEQAGAGDSKGVLLRSTTNFSTSSEFLNGQLLYEANTERRAILQETYIEVGPEIGQYVWRDTNEDGVQQIDEFFQELSPNEGTYVKQFVPSDELFPVIDLRSRFKNRWKPGALMEVSKYDPGWKKTLSELELNTMIEIRETSTTRDLQDIYLLKLDEFRNDSTTLEGQLFWQQSLHLFPQSTDYDLRLQVNQNRSMNQKAVGIERRTTSNYVMRGSYRLESDLMLETEIRYSEKRSSSQRLTNRNFDITEQLIQPGFDYIFSRSARAGLQVGWSRKFDRFSDRDTRVRMIKVVPTAQAYLFERVQTHMRVEWRSVKMDGPSSALGMYELTEGAGVGRSWRWSLRASYRISNLLRASLNYDGRTVPEEIPIQSLRFVINATF